MGATEKTLVPQLMRGSIERAPVTTLSLRDLLAKTHSLNIKQICQLARFVPVILLIPESSHGHPVRPRVVCVSERNCQKSKDSRPFRRSDKTDEKSRPR
jgi:hypothetical protein